MPGGGAPTPWILGDDGLSRGPGSRFIVAGWPAVRQIVQNIAYLNKAYRDNIPKYNRDIRFSLICEYEFGNENDCFSFICLLPEQCPLFGTLQMGIVGGAQVTYTTAMIEAITPAQGQSDQSVVSTRLQYDIVVGSPGTGGT